MRNTLIHIVNVSGGAASACCLLRVVERYGAQDVRAVFADTLIEDPSLYRFLDDLENVAGVKIDRISDGRSAWDVFQAESMFTNPQTGGCLASYHLKKLPLTQYRESFALPRDCIVYVGYDATEQDRINRLRSVDTKWVYDFPLLWNPVLLRCDQEDFLRRRGLTPCDMYDRGYSHANCGGTCVLAGLKQWAMVKQDYPERFEQAKQIEAKILEAQIRKGRTPYTILRRRAGGKSVDVSLEQLETLIVRGDVKGDDARVSSCSCVGTLFDF